jgi:hypothetical protein
MGGNHAAKLMGEGQKKRADLKGPFDWGDPIQMDDVDVKALGTAEGPSLGMLHPVSAGGGWAAVG